MMGAGARPQWNQSLAPRGSDASRGYSRVRVCQNYGNLPVHVTLWYNCASILVSGRFPTLSRTQFFSASRAVVLLFFCIFLMRSNSVAAGARRRSDPDLGRLNVLVAELKAQLQMPQEIHATIVPVNGLMVSVERTPDGFTIAFDASFLDSLDEEEVKAAVAHELGHVWIYSHHPYLQTEALANEIAMRVVTRDSLKRIYHRLWAHLGQTGNIEEFLGAEK
jgi:Zn-dependent protease with chaperone function